MKFFSRKMHKGFTLAEVMVSVTIFTIIVTVGIGALLTINTAYRKSGTERQAIDSLTYVLESMSRSIRTAQSWDVASGGASFRFVDQDGVKMEYRWDNPRIVLEVLDVTHASYYTLEPGIYDLTPGRVLVATSNADNTISFPGGGLTFTVMNGSGGTGQSYVQINLGGFVTEARQTSTFSFQTGVSKRVLDITP